ncbi:MAG: hypothetical protein ACLQUY_23145 [Ktedonobacterales bacterium]
MATTPTTPGATPSRAPKGRRLNVRLYTFVSKVITPAVLLLGLLFLAITHFNGVLANTTAVDNLYQGEQAYSMGPMSYTFQMLAGTDRPDILYNGFSILTYVDWSSTMSIDGHVSNLWDNYHGYDYDRQNTSDTEFSSTTSGYGWQLVEVAKLTSNHSVNIRYSFVSRPEGLAEPHQVIVTIEHTHESLYQPVINGDVMTAGVLSHEMTSVTSGDTPTPLGTLTVTVKGPAVPTSGAIAFDTLRANQNATGAYPVVTDTFTTTYVIDDPDVDRLTPLGSETIDFTPGTVAGTPVSFPLPVMTPTP